MTEDLIDLDPGLSAASPTTHTTRNVPAQLRLPVDWAAPGRPLHSQGLNTSGRGHTRESPVVANFIVPSSDGLSHEILETIHQQMVHKAGNHVVELRGIPPRTYIHIETGSEPETQALIQAARDLADDIVSDKPANTTALFHEPPASHTGVSQVTFEIREYGARPKLESLPLVARKHVGATESFVTNLSRAIYQGLKRAARQQSPLALAVNFGHFILQSYPRGQLPLEYQHFKTMVDGPRASGHLKTEIPDVAAAKQILATIQRGDGPLVPTNNQTQSAAEVEPAHTFEARWDQGRLQAGIEAVPDPKGLAKQGAVQYRLTPAKVFRMKSRHPELCLKIFSIGRAFDWAIEASEEDYPVSASVAINKFLGSASIRMQGHNLERWPRITLKSDQVVGGALGSIAIKSLYHFRWKTTPYIIEFSVNRRWAHISDMEKVPNVDFGISVFAEHWAQGSQAIAQVTNNAWGDELELLFKDEDPTSVGEERVQRFVSIIQGVQDVIDTVQEED